MYYYFYYFYYFITFIINFSILFYHFYYLAQEIPENQVKSQGFSAGAVGGLGGESGFLHLKIKEAWEVQEAANLQDHPEHSSGFLRASESSIERGTIARRNPTMCLSLGLHASATIQPQKRACSKGCFLSLLR